MRHSDLIGLARAVAYETEEKGFPNTAKAMLEAIDDLLQQTTEVPRAHMPAKSVKKIVNTS